MNTRTNLIIFLLILLLGIFFRFYLITEIPLGLYPDEAMNGNNALEALAGGNFKVFYPENNGREGLFINLQAILLWVIGNEPWVLRVGSAVLGALTILGIYLLTRELFMNYESGIKNHGNGTKKQNSLFMIRDSKVIALLSSFFLATSFWHINFSRIGFRAIMVPFFTAFGIYFLLRGLRRQNIWDIIWSGIFIGLGFHTYIAFRFMPFVAAIPIIWYFWKWYKTKNYGNETKKEDSLFMIRDSKDCIPCLIILFLFITFVAALPIGFYFLQNPQDFFGRAGDVSIFSADSPLIEFAKSNILTLGMFFVHGDCNWRHNFDCQPMLHPIVSTSFLIGILTIFKRTNALVKYTLIAWLFFMMLPATLTREGLPHALRAIGMIPPIMIISGLGAYSFLQWILNWLETQKEKRSKYLKQLARIQKEATLLLVLILFLIPNNTFKNYFILWANRTETYSAFSTDILHLGQYLNNLPPNIKKFVIVNLPGVDVRGIPMPAQTVMFATNTFREKEREQKNIVYITQDALHRSKIYADENTVIAPLNGSDRELIKYLRMEFPDFKIHAPSDFIIMQNY